MTNNRYSNWKIATVFLCIASFTSSVFCGENASEQEIRGIITNAYKIETIQDAQDILETLSDANEEVAIEIILRLSPSLNSRTSLIENYDTFTSLFLFKLNQCPKHLTLDQQMYLLCAVMLDEHYQSYHQIIAGLETQSKINVLMYMASYAQSKIVEKLIPIYHEIGKLDARSNKGFNALSSAIYGALSPENDHVVSHYKEVVTLLTTGGASLNGSICYRNGMLIEVALQILEHPREMDDFYAGELSNVPNVDTIIRSTNKITTFEDAQRLLDTLFFFDKKTAIFIVTRLASSFSKNSNTFPPHNSFTWMIKTELAKKPAATLHQQVYLLCAALMNEHYKNYHYKLAHLKTINGATILLHAVAKELSSVVNKLTPICRRIGNLNTRSDDGFTALSYALSSIHQTNDIYSLARYSTIISSLINQEGSRFGTISYFDKTPITVAILDFDTLMQPYLRGDTDAAGGE